jgi:hypothetical protein
MSCGGAGKIACYGDSTGTVQGHGWYAIDLSTSTATYQALFAFPKAGGYPYIEAMNGASLSPIDSYVYALAKIRTSSNTVLNGRLIRFGSLHADRTNPEFEYVAIADYRVNGGESLSSVTVLQPGLIT